MTPPFCHHDLNVLIQLQHGFCWTISSIVSLKPIIPKTWGEISHLFIKGENYEENKKRIEEVKDPERRSFLLNQLNLQSNRFALGLPNLQDKRVSYNPFPLFLFYEVTNDIWRTIQALLFGAVSPKHFVGPVGIIQFMHTTSKISLKETAFWLGFISLNLGILNLFPIPLLDGGTILLSLFVMVTRRRLKPKVMERIVTICAILLISFFVFLVYNDLLRIFTELVQK